MQEISDHHPKLDVTVSVSGGKKARVKESLIMPKEDTSKADPNGVAF